MFNPFGKNLTDITETDLDILRTVAEGWYIEYKSAVPDSKKIAKSIASLSNSYGGLYILGVESDKNTNCAIRFPGVDIKIDLIHDAVRGNLNPFPYFECYTILLQNGKSVVIVVVEEGFDPPCIHNDGRIYRRQESSSDPMPETNRYSIDQLYERAKKYKEKLEDFRTIDYGFCKGEENQPYLICYVNPTRIEEQLINDFGNPEFHQKILDMFNKEFDINESQVGRINGRLVFDNITLFPDSIILRNLSDGNIAYNRLTVELFKNGGMKFMMPIKLVDFNHPSVGKIKEYLPRYDSHNYHIIKWTPIYDFVVSVIGLFINYIHFLDNYNYKYKDDLELVFEGRDIWRVCLFSEEDAYLDYIKKFSLPIIIKDNIQYPEKTFRIHMDSKSDGKHSFIMFLYTILGLALYGFGMPVSEAFNIFITETRKKVRHDSQ
jgi:hypothetical protein